jgi:hypothetical protein
LTKNNTPEFALRIRVKTVPPAGEFDEFNLSHLRAETIVVLPAQLASLLILAGHAELLDDHPSRAEAADFGQPKFPRRR